MLDIEVGNKTNSKFRLRQQSDELAWSWFINSATTAWDVAWDSCSISICSRRL